MATLKCSVCYFIDGSGILLNIVILTKKIHSECGFFTSQGALVTVMTAGLTGNAVNVLMVTGGMTPIRCCVKVLTTTCLLMIYKPIVWFYIDLICVFQIVLQVALDVLKGCLPRGAGNVYQDTITPA